MTDGLFEYDDQQSQRYYRNMGLTNGVLFGLALSIGIWGPHVLTLSNLPMTLRFGSIAAASLLLILLCGFAGRLTARVAKGWFSLLLWLGASLVAAILIGLQPFQLRNLMIWLADLRFWGLTIFETGETSLMPLIFAGFFIILALTFLGILQDYRLEGILGALGRGGRVTGRAIMLLLLPLPLVAVAGFVTSNIYGSAATPTAVKVVNETISTSQGYEGDLKDLTLETGLNYNAIRGLHDRMGSDYTVMLGEIDPTAATTVVVHFSNGTWIECQVLGDQLSFCGDAAPPYTIGLDSLITGEELSEDCLGCMPNVDDEWVTWLQERQENFVGSPIISRVAQQGGYVIMRAESVADGYAIECQFNGLGLPRLESCTEVEK